MTQSEAEAISTLMDEVERLQGQAEILQSELREAKQSEERWEKEACRLHGVIDELAYTAKEAIR